MDENKDRSPLQEIASEEEDQESALEPFVISTYPADFTLEVLVEKWTNKEIRKEGFQRRYVWPQVRASKLIESFLLGLPVPPVYLYKDKEDSGLLVVDGHQRLRTIVYFFSGWFGDREEIPEGKLEQFTLIGLHEKSQFHNATFESLKKDTKAMNNLKTSVLRSFIMQQLEPDDDTSMFEIFSRLNTGGMDLRPQEIRNCVCEGEFNTLLKELNEYPSWRKIFGIKKADKRMRDIELILRFLALFYTDKKYKKPMKDFLNSFMKTHRRPPKAQDGDTKAEIKRIDKKRQKYLEQQEEFKKRFYAIADLVVQYLGEKPFHIIRGLNVAVFDSIFTAFARQFQDLTSIKKPSAQEISRVKNRLHRLFKNPDYLEWISSATTDDDVVPKRIAKAQTVLFR